MDFDIDGVDEDTVVKLLEKESFYRKSEAFQDLYDRMEYYKGSADEFVETTIQKLVLQEFGFNPSDENLAGYRMIARKFGDSERVINSAFYLKYNIMKDAPIVKLGEYVCNVSLFGLDDNVETDLFSFLNSDRPTVILAGSIS